MRRNSYWAGWLELDRGRERLELRFTEGGMENVQVEGPERFGSRVVTQSEASSSSDIRLEIGRRPGSLNGDVGSSVLER